jgi:predicted ATPase/DNA-binding NarL/FixJ family response regulator
VTKRSLTPGPANVPGPPTRLVGREEDVSAVLGMLDDAETRLITLTGPGGVGKTHLALETADRASSRFPDGVFVIWLSPVRNPELVLPTIAQALGLRETPGEVIVDVLVNALADRDALIVLDNMEQVVEAVPDIGVLIAATRRPRFLVTSRSPMRLRVEREYPVQPLPLPSNHPATGFDAISGNAAVQLFVERAQAARPSFALTDANAGAIADICRRLDGLPLAIELAAAMTPVLTPTALAGRMQRRLPLLVHGAADLPDRQRTLAGAIGWSYDLLDPAEQTLFRNLSVFAGSATLDAIDAITGHSGATLFTISSLVNKSLLMRLDDIGIPGTTEDEPRFRMLSTIREFAADALEESGESSDVHARLLAWLLEQAATAEVALTGPDQAAWLKRLDIEHDNIRALLAWALDHSPREGMLLASMMWRYWATRGGLSEGHAWLTRFLERPEGTDAERAKAYGSVGNLCIDLGDYPGAAAAYQRALGLWESIGETRGIANSLNGLGLVEWYQGDYDSARHRHETALALRRQIGDRFGQANSLTNLGNVIKDAGDASEARTYHLQALEIRQDLGDRVGVGFSYLNLADTGRRMRDPDNARQMFIKSLTAFRDVGDRLGEGYALHGLGLAELLAGNARLAARYLADGLDIRANLGDRRGIAECIEGIASAMTAGQRHADATVLFAAADTLRNRIGAPIPAPDQILLAPDMEFSHRELAPEDCARHQETGASLTLPDAISWAKRTATELAQSSEPRPQENGSLLSDREVDVVRLVAQGMTNGEVANELFLSRRTVDAHLRRIYDKLDLTSRADLVRYATLNGFVSSDPSLPPRD